MNQYEIVFLLDPTIEEAEVENKFNSLEELLRGQGAEIMADLTLNWGKRRLAYPVKKKENAIFRVYRFQSAPAAISEIDRRLRLDEQILRSMIVIYEPEAGVSRKSPTAEAQDD